MKTARIYSRRSAQTVAVNPFERGLNAVTSFMTRPAGPEPLAALRIGVSAVLLLQAMALSFNLLDLYGSRGVVQWVVTDPAVGPTVPRIRWLVDALAPLGVSEAAAVRGLFAVYVGGLAGLLIGCRTRWSALAAWLAHLMMNASATATIYGVDSFANIVLFYCIWMPVAGAWSVDASAGRVARGASAEARLALRVLQLHLCIVYLASGIEKAWGADWWNGEAIWCSLMRSDLCAFDMSWLSRYPLLAQLAAIGTLVVELGYAALVWPRRTRRLWAATTVSLHVGIAIFLGLWSFAALMSVLTFAAFLVPGDVETTVGDGEIRRSLASA